MYYSLRMLLHGFHVPLQFLDQPHSSHFRGNFISILLLFSLAWFNILQNLTRWGKIIFFGWPLSMFCEDWSQADQVKWQTCTILTGFVGKNFGMDLKIYFYLLRDC